MRVHLLFSCPGSWRNRWLMLQVYHAGWVLPLQICTRYNKIETFIHFLKGTIGLAILCLPWSLKFSGLLIGPIGIVVMASIAVAGMYGIVCCSRVLCQRTGQSSLDFGAVAYEASLPYSEMLGRYFRMAVNIFLVITQFGLCCDYILFISQQLILILEACGISFDGLSTIDRDRIMIAAIGIPMVVSALIRNLDDFTFLSLTANIALTVSVFVILCFTFTHLNLTEPGYGGRIKDLPFAASVSSLPLFFGTVAFSFENIGAVLPTENKMKQPKAFTWVFLSASVLVIALSALTAVMGYLTFGDNIKPVLILNLPLNGKLSWLFSVSQLLYIYAIYVSYLIQFYILMTIVEPSVLNWATRQQWRQPNIASYALRIGTMLLAVLATLAIPRLSLFLPLVGAIGCGALAFIFPPIIFLLTFHSELALRSCLVSTLVKIVCIAVSVMGVLGSILCVYASVEKILEFYRQ
ncbi:neutral amino acid uniporter 4-like isoform X2 [Corticium candelabrum]|uniref:neutral amino acid uniporter 4-like isoform X2 n=2 Tax=Corticium candelabrum TaxID=121492 RepID=UPI002E25838F|nr:neutral amino acid uniporter 4-like isoform X2 [Corticium candelabrum]